MKAIIKSGGERNSFISFTASLLLHILFFAAAYFFANVHLNKVNPNAGYVQVFTQQSDSEPVNFEKNINPTEEKETESKILESKNEKVQESSANVTLNFLDQNADTTSLEQIYSESTLNVSIKYPAGWTFLDQNVNKKLDGVTFWANISNINPPPYVHLQVCDKDLFNESKYKHNLPLRQAVIYFNDQENLANYVSQTFYFRTEKDEDFSLKLTIKGEKEFSSFAPIFYAMLKSFKFYDSVF